MFHKENHLPEQEYTINHKIQQVIRNFGIFRNFLLRCRQHQLNAVFPDLRGSALGIVVPMPKY